MTKSIFKIIIFILIILIICILYVAYFGINTSKFNSLIKDEIKNHNSKIDIDLKKVKLHLDLKNILIKIKTQNPTLIINRSKNIELEEISSNISIRSYFQNKFAIKNLSIRSKNTEIKNFIELYRVNTNTPQIILLNQIIKKGNIKLNANLNFDQSGKINKDYKISGNVKNAEFGLIKFKNLKRLSFNFIITDKNYDLNNILFKS